LRRARSLSFIAAARDHPRGWSSRHERHHSPAVRT
jgi:hypothetical protein